MSGNWNVLTTPSKSIHCWVKIRMELQIVVTETLITKVGISFRKLFAVLCTQLGTAPHTRVRANIPCTGI